MASEKRAKRILYVDDEESLALLGQEFLGDLGYQVEVAFSGAAALEKFCQPPSYDLVVTDESMPSMSGIELAQKIFQQAPEVPVVLCSGHLLTMDELGIEATNVKDVLVKTEVCTKLPDILEDLLGG